MNYLVRWEVEIVAAASPREAAGVALEIQRDPAGLSVIFEVAEIEPDPDDVPVSIERVFTTIDLLNEGERS